MKEKLKGKIKKNLIYVIIFLTSVCMAYVSYCNDKMNKYWIIIFILSIILSYLCLYHPITRNIYIGYGSIVSVATMIYSKVGLNFRMHRRYYGEPSYSKIPAGLIAFLIFMLGLSCNYLTQIICIKLYLIGNHIVNEKFTNYADINPDIEYDNSYYTYQKYARKNTNYNKRNYNTNKTQENTQNNFQDYSKRNLIYCKSTKYFQNCSDINEAAKRFRQLSKQYHPDMPSGNADIFTEIDQEYEKVKRYFNSVK